MTSPNLPTLVGSVSGALSVVSFVPQALRAWQTRQTRDLSIWTCALLVSQSFGWMAYGLLIHQRPIIWTNACVMSLSVSILVAKLRHG